MNASRSLGEEASGAGVSKHGLQAPHIVNTRA